MSVFEDFARGFSRGKTLFDFVDVGPGKDRADEKIIGTSDIGRWQISGPLTRIRIIAVVFTRLSLSATLFWVLSR